jgi:hypothetical protein
MLVLLLGNSQSSVSSSIMYRHVYRPMKLSVQAVFLSLTSFPPEGYPHSYMRTVTLSSYINNDVTLTNALTSHSYTFFSRTCPSFLPLHHSHCKPNNQQQIYPQVHLHHEVPSPTHRPCRPTARSRRNSQTRQDEVQRQRLCRRLESLYREVRNRLRLQVVLRVQTFRR